MIRSASSALRGSGPGPRNAQIHSIREYSLQGLVTMKNVLWQLWCHGVLWLHQNFWPTLPEFPLILEVLWRREAIYAAYKVEQASTYTQDKLSAIKDFSSGVSIQTSEFFQRGGDPMVEAA